MITKFKIYESEVSTGNAGGKAGVSSIPFGRGFFQSGYNNGEFGIQFTPTGEPVFQTYKSMKHSKDNLKKKKKKMKKFEEFLNEDAVATMGNTGGMGPVVSAQPSSTPGDVTGGTKGSGDIGSAPAGAFMKSPVKSSFAPLTKKGKAKKNKREKIKSFDNFKP